MSDIIVHKLNKKFFDAVTITGSSSSTSECINSYSLYAIQHIWTSFTGSIKLVTEGSNNDIDYTTVDTTTISGASGSRLINVEKAGYSHVRVSVTFISGSAILTSIINAKVL